MKTTIFTARELGKAAELITKGELVAFPTETVYGLGANAFDSSAVKKIFRAKGRPADNPLIVHIAQKSQVYEIAAVEVSERKVVNKLIQRFWPGPLTIILNKKKTIPMEVTGGLDTVAVRMPKNKLARKLITLSGVPLAAPSANVSGRPSGTCFEHIYDDFNGKIAGIIRSEDSDIGIESTVIDVTTEPPVLLRPGALSFEELVSVLPTLRKVVSKNSMKIKAPGMKYRHYSPNAKILLFEQSARHKIAHYVRKYRGKKKIKVIHPNKTKTFSKNFFKMLRECDKEKVDLICISAIDEKGIGLAVMNRIRKAASTIIR